MRHSTENGTDPRIAAREMILQATEGWHEVGEHDLAREVARGATDGLFPDIGAAIANAAVLRLVRDERPGAVTPWFLELSDERGAVSGVWRYCPERGHSFLDAEVGDPG